MNNLKKIHIAIMMLSLCGSAYADLKIYASNGNSVVFSQEKTGDHIDANSWSKLLFSHGDATVDISQKDRYYSENGTSKFSPSGNYLVVNSVAGNYVDTENGREYSDRAYCSVIDMRDGCIVSDWDGEACGFDWINGKDVLAASDSKDAEVFDFMSARPAMNKMVKSPSSLSSYEISNMLRCDKPDDKNIESYQLLMKENKGSKKDVSVGVVNYLNSLKSTLTLKSKTAVYSSPNDTAKTKGYLIPGDTVKVIQRTADNKWINVGYINAKGTPLVTWIKQ